MVSNLGAGGTIYKEFSEVPVDMPDGVVFFIVELRVVSEEFENLVGVRSIHIDFIKELVFAVLCNSGKGLDLYPICRLLACKLVARECQDLQP